MLTLTGWILSPAYDLNPNPTGTGLKLNISETDNMLNLDLAMKVLPYFRVSEKRVLEVVSSAIQEVLTIHNDERLSSWKRFKMTETPENAIFRLLKYF